MVGGGKWVLEMMKCETKNGVIIIVLAHLWQSVYDD